MLTSTIGRCPACHGTTANTTTSGHVVEDSLCNNCENELEQMDTEYGVWLASAPVWERAFYAVKRAVYTRRKR